jgi:hypothetical protein
MPPPANKRRPTYVKQQCGRAASTAATSSVATTATAPPKTVEVVRQLVEQDEVLALFQTLGTPPNTAIQGYLNETGNGSLAASPVRAIIFRNPAVVVGPPRSVMKTYRVSIFSRRS